MPDEGGIIRDLWTTLKPELSDARMVQHSSGTTAACGNTSVQEENMKIILKFHIVKIVRICDDIGCAWFSFTLNMA